MASNGETPRDLTSWKEIAQFLGVSVRSAQRYETEMGLPVRRLGGDKGRAVAASADDLLAWKKKNVAAPRFWNDPRFLRAYAIASTGIIVLLSLPLIYRAIERSRVGPPTATHWINSTLVATDTNGREVWRRGFPYVLNVFTGAGPFHGDLDGDGAAEVVLPYITEKRDAEGTPIICISQKGQELWRIQPRRSVSDRKTKFTNIFVFRDYKIFPSPEADGTKWIAATFAHHFEYPSVAVVLDSRGKTRGEYWHSGHLDFVHVQDLNNDGRQELILAGMDLGSSRAVLRVFDPRNVTGASVLPPGDTNQLQGFGPGSELATVRFERSRLNRKLVKFNYAYRIDPGDSDSSFFVSVSENISRHEGSYLIYTIAPDLSLIRVVPSAALLGAYVSASMLFDDSDVQQLRDGYTVQRSKTK